MTRAVDGIWCPWAEVLCLACHGPTLRNRDRSIPAAEWDRRETERDLDTDPEANEGIGRCDQCGRPVIVRGDVALLCQIRDRLNAIDDAPPMALQQTGGMCAALAGADAHRIVVVSALDGPICVGSYHAADDEWQDPIEEEGGEIAADEPDPVTAATMLVIGCFAAGAREVRS